MKRLQTLSCVLLALGLAACAAPAGEPQAAPVETAAPAAAQTAETAETADAPAGEIYLLPYISEGRGYNTGDAYYEFLHAEPGISDRSALIVKTDYATLTQTPVCRVEGCTHDSEACPAYLPSADMMNFFVLDGAVYLYHMGTPEDSYSMTYEQLEDMLDREGIAGEDAEHRRDNWKAEHEPTYIDVIAADGLSRRRLLTVEPEADWFYRLCYSDGAALYGNKRILRTQSDKTGTRLDLATGEAQTFPMMEEEITMGTMDGRILTYRYVTDEPLPESDTDLYWTTLQNSQIEFDLLEPAAGGRVQVYSAPYMDSLDRNYFANYGGRLFFMVYVYGADSQRSAYRVEYYDIHTGETGVLADGLSGAIRTGEGSFMPVGGGREQRYCWVNGEDGADYSLDLETGALYKTTQPFTGESWQSLSDKAMAVAETNDGRWLIAYRSHNGGYSRCDYGLIDREAFLAGSEEYELVEMWE